MEKTPCIKCDEKLWKYIMPHLKEWGYKICSIDSWEKFPFLILDYEDLQGEKSVTNLCLGVDAIGFRELVTDVEEFLERAAKLKGFTYKRKDMKQEFTKSDLKTGMVVEYKNGTRRLVLEINESIFLSGDMYTKPCDFITLYNDNLEQIEDRDKTINKVFEIKRPCVISEIFNSDNLHLIWERKKILEVTMDEVAEKFGVEKGCIRIK